MGIKADLEQLLQRIQGSDRNLKRADFELLSDLSRPELADFAQVWERTPADARIGLISALAQMTSDSFEYSFERVFKEVLNDPEPQARVAAIRGLWECEDEHLAGRLLRLLKDDPDAEVRAAAASGLGSFVYLAELEELNQTAALAIETALLTAAQNPTEMVSVRRRAVESLGFSSSADVVNVVRDAYEDGDPDLRTSALAAMGRSANRRWRRIVLRELDSLDSQVRLEAARACGELELRESVLPLTRLIEQDKSLKVRQAAVGALGRAGGPTAKKVLDLIMSTEDGPLYDAAQDAMEELRFASECPEVGDLLRSVDDDEDDDDLYDALEEPAGLFDDYAEEYDNEEEDEDADDDEDEDWEPDAGVGRRALAFDHDDDTDSDDEESEDDTNAV